jgi:hypothetical protein
MQVLWMALVTLGMAPSGVLRLPDEDALRPRGSPCLLNYAHAY